MRAESPEVPQWVELVESPEPNHEAGKCVEASNTGGATTGGGGKVQRWKK